MENKLNISVSTNGEEQKVLPKPDFKNNPNGYQYGHYSTSYNDGSTWVEDGYWWSPKGGNFAFPVVGSLLKRTDIIDKNKNIIYSICAKNNEKISGFGGGDPLKEEFFIKNIEKFERNMCVF